MLKRAIAIVIISSIVLLFAAAARCSAARWRAQQSDATAICLLSSRDALWRQDLIKLFLHEMSRQFRDRLINDEDRNWFNQALSDKLNLQVPRACKVEDLARPPDAS